MVGDEMDLLLGGWGSGFIGCTILANAPYKEGQMMGWGQGEPFPRWGPGQSPEQVMKNEIFQTIPAPVEGQ